MILWTGLTIELPTVDGGSTTGHRPRIDSPGDVPIEGEISMAQYEAARPTTFLSPETAAERVSSFLRSVYAWMCGGLAVTAATAVVVAASPAIVTAIATNRL